jgi:hypothetical protein
MGEQGISGTPSGSERIVKREEVIRRRLIEQAKEALITEHIAALLDTNLDPRDLDLIRGVARATMEALTEEERTEASAIANQIIQEDLPFSEERRLMLERAGENP